MRVLRGLLLGEQFRAILERSFERRQAFANIDDAQAAEEVAGALFAFDPATDGDEHVVRRILQLFDFGCRQIGLEQLGDPSVDFIPRSLATGVSLGQTVGDDVDHCG